MHKPILLFTLFSNEQLSQTILKSIPCDLGNLAFHHFPDGETSVTIQSDVQDRTLVFLATLDRPNSKIIPLLFAAETAKALGAKRIILVAPYLAYMREDKAFHLGEGISAHHFAKILSTHFDELITVDPHLHRITSLDQVYTIQSTVLHAAGAIAHWIETHVRNPLLIGPDSESEQWVGDIAQKANAPHIVLEKIRKGDRDIQVILPSMEAYQDKTPILVDDIISTGRTLIEPIKQLVHAIPKHYPICIGVHAVFSDDAYQDLLRAGAEKIITCNSIQHISNHIDLGNVIADSLRESIT